MNSICVFCSASNTLDQSYYDLAAALGRLLAHAGIHTIYGGSKSGMMGALAESALAEGGRVSGVFPEVLPPGEHVHPDLSALYVVPDMHTRQKKMADLADGFITLPGGLGTLAEFFEVITWRAIGVHDKPIALLNYQGYWSDLVNQLEASAAGNFFHKGYKDLFVVAETLDDLDIFLKG